MTTLEQVRARIIELVPEIVELKFGCRVVWHYEHQIGGIRSRGGLCRFGRNKEAVVIEDRMVSGVLIRIEENLSLRSVNPTTLTIIGRPITLEDVLRAVQKSGECWKLDTIMDGNSIRLVVKDRCLYAQPVTNTKTNFELFIESMVGRISADWHLNKSLEEQSEETIEFIGSILGV